MMATPNTSHRRLLLLLTILVIAANIASSSSSPDIFSFTFGSSSNTLRSSPSKLGGPFSSLILQGDATAPDRVRLSAVSSDGKPKTNSVGRALYPEVIPIWRESIFSSYPNEVVSFNTTFKFVLNYTAEGTPGGHGLTFFFAPEDSIIPPNSDGGLFGLFSKDTLPSEADVIDSPSQILAVEFDSYIDGKWDPKYTHIGINVNTVKSRAEVPWPRKAGQAVTANVYYDNVIKKLYVRASYYDGDVFEVSSSVDLDAVLSKRSVVGFSASTGDTAVDIHEIGYWSFETKLPSVAATSNNIYSA